MKFCFFLKCDYSYFVHSSLYFSFKILRLSSDPVVLYFPSFASPDECRHLIGLAKARMGKGKVGRGKGLQRPPEEEIRGRLLEKGESECPVTRGQTKLQQMAMPAFGDLDEGIYKIQKLL
jgi:hypothetical protein